MRSVHLIKAIEDTIKRGPKSKSRFATVNTPILGCSSRPGCSAFSSAGYSLGASFELAGAAAGTASTARPAQNPRWERRVDFYPYQSFIKAFF